MKYTREDFEQAKFAEHEDGRRAVRTSTPVAPWIMEMRNGPGHCAKDSEMALDGWVPVSTKPTITRSQVKWMQERLTNHLIPWSQVQKMLAHAWDEGYEVGWERGHYEVETETNPYRTVKDN